MSGYASQMEKVRTWAESMGILPKDCVHAGRRRVYRAGPGGDPDKSDGVLVLDDCVDCGKEFMVPQMNVPDGSAAPGKYDDVRHPQKLYFAGTPVGADHPVLAEGGPSKVGERVEGCARCRVRTPGRSFCSSCGDRSTSFELRPGESGW